MTLLWIFFDNIIVWAHSILILKVSAWEICNMKWGFAKKVKIKSQRQVMYGSIFYESDVILFSPTSRLVLVQTSFLCWRWTFCFTTFGTHGPLKKRLNNSSWSKYERIHKFRSRHNWKKNGQKIELSILTVISVWSFLAY